MPTPCQPLLNPVPNGGAGSPFPAPLTSGDVPIFDQPTFGPDIRQLLGTAGDTGDGWDQAVAALESTIAQWDTEQAAQDAQLDAILTDLANKTDSSSLDTSMGDYVGSFDAGNAILNTAQGIVLPAAPTVPTWITSVGAVTITPPSGPGVQVPGQVTVGDAPFVFKAVMGAPGPQSFQPGNPRILTKSDIFTGVSFVSAVWESSRSIPGQNVSGAGWVVTLNVNVNPGTAGVFSDWIELDAYNPVLANKFLHPIQVEVRPKLT